MLFMNSLIRNVWKLVDDFFGFVLLGSNLWIIGLVDVKKLFVFSIVKCRNKGLVLIRLLVLLLFSNV